MAKTVTCPHCLNIMGFVCGTCIECGFNHLSNKFDWIKVHVEDLPTNPKTHSLIQEYSEFTKRTNLCQK
jgi:hypothetical protein